MPQENRSVTIPTPQHRVSIVSEFPKFTFCSAYLLTSLKGRINSKVSCMTAVARIQKKVCRFLATYANFSINNGGTISLGNFVCPTELFKTPLGDKTVTILRPSVPKALHNNH